MKRAFAVISTLFQCGAVGGLYGAALGVIYAWLFCVSDGLGVGGHEGLLACFALAVMYGAPLGFPAGVVSGVLGACLGGPVGYGIGGFVGTSAIMLLCFGRAEDLTLDRLFTVYPSILGAAFGLVLGLHLRRRLPLLPGVKRLADRIYSSPVGGWLGWRQRQVE